MTIARAVLDEVLAHARESAPLECCGLLLGQPGQVLLARRAKNLEASPTRFLIDPVDHIAARREAKAQGCDVVGFYHSHPRTAAVPSASDVAEAFDDQAIHLIAGWPGELPEVRAFRISSGAVEELNLIVD